MTPQEALKMLDGLCAQMSLPREGHMQVNQAMQVLAQCIGQPPVLEEVPDAEATA